MELFKNTNYDFLGKKWPFIIASLVLSVAGLASIAMKGGIKYGIDFRGGAMMFVKFTGPPPVDKIRSSLGAQKILGSVDVQRAGEQSANEVIVSTELPDEKALNQARSAMISTLENTFGDPKNGKLDSTTPLRNRSRTGCSIRCRRPASLFPNPRSNSWPRMRSTSEIPRRGPV
jgi:preprotein translocase subunit SecF